MPPVSGRTPSTTAREERHETDVYARPIEYIEWSELDGIVQIHNALEVGGTMDWYPEAGYALEVYVRADPLPPHEPGTLDRS